MTYQSRIAAWLYVRMLAGIRGPAVGEAPNLTIEAVRCEADQPVDDVVVEFSDGSRVLIQAKHGLSWISANEASAFAGAIHQFVHQSALSRATQPNRNEVMVLIVDPSASGSIRNELRPLLERFASAPSGRMHAVPSSAREHELHRILEEIVCRQWQGIAGTAPSAGDVEDVLRRTRIRVLDVDADGSDERAARDLLQTAVLTDTTAVEAAWASIIDYASQAVSVRGWVDRVTLQQYLSARAVGLRPALGDRDDIERLRAFSSRTAERLSRHRTVSFGGTEVHIRREVLEELERAAALGPLVVIGDPGCGKSAVLHDLAGAMAVEHDVVVIAADTFDESGVAVSAGLTRELDAVLRQWPGVRPGILIVDALDAARSERAAAQLRDLIEHVSRNAPRWRVVASIRTYDLRYGTQLARLFAGTPPGSAANPEFAKVRHVSVGRLSESEIAQLLAHLPDLKNALARAPSDLVALLGNIFNVRLFAEVVAAGEAVDSLHSVRTQADLLERYWGARVLSGSGAERDAREVVLTRAVEKMVSTRALRANRRDIVDASGALDSLLSANVLMEWRAVDDARPVRAVIAFTHHIVFDYAVECLHLRPDPGPLKLIEEDPSLVVAIRPSLVLHFQYLWGEGQKHPRFWSLAIDLAGSAQVPEIAKIVGPHVASENVVVLEDLGALLNSLTNESRSDQAELVLQHLIGAVVAGSKTAQRGLVGANAGPWCELAAFVTQRETRGTAAAITTLLRSVYAGSDTPTATQLNAAGRAARWLFDYVITPANYNPFWIRDAIRLVARTFASSPVESAVRLRALLSTDRTDLQLQAEIAALAAEIEHLINIAPELARDAYTFVFTLDVRSNESIPLGPGRIFGLSTTINQQIEHARYLLAKTFSAFLVSAPAAAAEALGFVVEDYVQRRHPVASGEHTEEAFTFRNNPTSIVTDYSEVWDSTGTYADDHPLEMLDDFDGALSNAASESGLEANWNDALLRLLQVSRKAIIWRRILLAAARQPATLGRELRELGWTPTILAGHDTTVPAGAFLQAVFPILEAEEKERVETCIIRLPNSEAGHLWRPEAREHIRDRLLGCLTDPVTAAAQKRLAEVAAQPGGPPANESPYRIRTGSGQYTTTDYLRDLGVAVDEPGNLSLRGLAEPLTTFAERFNGSAPDGVSRDDALSQLASLIGALKRADADGVDPKLQNYAWGVAAHAASRIVWCSDLDLDGRDAIVVEALLQASTNVEPEFRPEVDANFNRAPSWGSPAARIDAAEGLTVLAGRGSTMAIEAAVRRLAADAVAAVRFQVFTYLGGLFNCCRRTFDDLVGAASTSEMNRGVLRVLVDRVLHPLASEDPRRAIELTRLIYARSAEGDGADSVRETCIALFVRAHLWKKDPLAAEALKPIMDRAEPEAAGCVTECLRSALTVGATDLSDDSAAAVRREAISLLTCLAGVVRDRIDAALNIPAERRTSEDNERLRGHVELADKIVREVYFGSGAYDLREGVERAARDRISPNAHRRFVAESADLVDALVSLSEFGVVSLTHHLLETIETFIEIDAERSFKRIATLFILGARGDYQFETLAVPLVVRLFERFLADHRALLQEPENQRRLIESLDIFVKAGWPEAWQLTYRLDEIFR